ncbi:MULTISPECIES: TonB-dependent receptor [unclassified Novosphingobium]|uniref:TonB-dependent receptor n=1 Tax=unclassified Novosphingobium TaxID=2644732 RepID=UPI00020EF82C|nr:MULTISPECIES: TonB-dependent receptor [unclassified Novosphingobium]GFM28942.1 TonB-dependent receptor-like protein [Novosphingobium sp. PY1]CCA90182.1 TonB-dependent receptor [Novosphingobium sp. PP1Y]
MKLFRNTLLGATFLMGVGTTSAYAQDAAAGGETGGDIVVTATRRATSLQDVPINISAVGEEQLSRQRIDDVRDLADFTPGMTISDTGPGSTGSIVLRGLNASDVDSTGASYDDALGMYLGEVPLYYDFKLLDIARVETLLGPQGTLYGLGTLAGAIRNIPNRPNTDTIEGEVHGRFYGKQHSGKLGYQVDGVINIPIVTDHVAFRSATGYFYDPGFIDYPLLLQEPGVSLPQPSGPDGVTDADYAANLMSRKDLNFEKTFTTRNQLLVQFSEDLKVNFTYAYQQTKTDGGQYNSDGVLGTGKYESAGRYIEPVNRHAHLGSMEINANLADIADLVATTAYTNVRNRTQADNTDLLLDLDYGYETFPAFSSWNEADDHRKQFNQEVRFVSRHGGPFSWVLGGFYNEQKRQRDYIEHVPNHPWVEFGTQPNPDEVEYASFVKSKVTEKAVFGEGTFRVTPAWQVTAGARYFGYTSNISGLSVLPLLGDPVSPYDLEPAGGKTKKSGWVWKFNSSYNFTPDLMVYATYSKGYRIGGPNTVAPCILPLDPTQQNVCALPNEIQYGPDTTKNAEIGVRAQFFDRKLNFNFNVFQIKWSGIQVDSATLNGIVGITVNGGKAKSQGFETSFQVLPLPGLSIQGTYSYVDAKLTEDVPGIITINDPAGTYPSNPIQLDALDGDRLPGSAKHSGSLGATYTMPVMAGNLVADWTATYRGNVVTRLGWDRAYGDRLPSYVLHRASLTYEADRYSIGLFANNIFDKYAVASVSNDRSRVGLNDGVLLRYYKQTVINPRTFGIELRYKY